MIKITVQFFLLLGLISNGSLVKAETGLLRLFTTAQEREQLNKERMKLKKPETGRVSEDKSGPKPPRYITFNGLITRSQGPSMVWVNGRHDLFQEGFVVEVHGMVGEQIPIYLSHSKQRIWLKPGQTVDTLNGKVKRSFEQLSQIQANDEKTTN